MSIERPFHDSNFRHGLAKFEASKNKIQLDNPVSTYSQIYLNMFSTSHNYNTRVFNKK